MDPPPSSTPSKEEDYSWLHSWLWLSDQPDTGQLVVTRFDAKSGVTKGYPIEGTLYKYSPPSAPAPEAQSPGSEEEVTSSAVNNINAVYYSNVYASAAEKAVFEMGGDGAPGNGIIRPVDQAVLWPPRNITQHEEKTEDTSGNRRTFCLELSDDDDGTKLFNFAAINPKLFTPDEKHPWRGIWIGLFPGHGFEVMLFCQPTEGRLEAIKLTGDAYVPRGEHSIIVEDLSIIRRQCEDARWRDCPIVPAKIQGADMGFVNNRFFDAELFLVNENEVLIVLENEALQLVRAELDHLLSPVSDCCLCPDTSPGVNPLLTPTLDDLSQDTKSPGVGTGTLDGIPGTCLVGLNMASTDERERFRAAWAAHQGDDWWLKLDTNCGNDSGFTFIVAIDDHGFYQIQDSARQLLPHIFPPLQFLSTNEDESIARVINILRHLARFQAMKTLRNPNTNSQLAANLVLLPVSLTGKVLREVDGVYEVEETQPFYLQLENRSGLKVFIKKLDLQPEFYEVGNVDIHESGQVAPGAIVKLPTLLIIPKEFGNESVVDILKIMVSESDSLFKSSDLELDDLVKSQKESHATSGANSSLQYLLQNLHHQNEHSTNAKTVEWQALQVRVRVYPRKQRRTVVEDAEFLGLGHWRHPVLSAFELPPELVSNRPRTQQADDGALNILCKCCMNFLSRVRLHRSPSDIIMPPPSQHRLHHSERGLRESAAGGCHFCTLILYHLGRLGHLDKKPTSGEISSEGIYLLYSCFYGRGRQRIDIRGDTRPTSLECPYIYVSRQATVESLDHFIKPGWVPPGYIKFPGTVSTEFESQPSLVPRTAITSLSTSSPEHMRLANGWWKGCLESHEDCAEGFDPNFIPTRMLYVGTSTQSSSSLHLYLADKSPSGHRPPYCALSHCWGGVSDIPLLKGDTLNAFRKGIDIASLPRSFQDAILITRQLDVKFLWIDSLCIVQDDGNDWAREAATMGKVYGNALVTIAAAEARNSHEGCFVHRDPRCANPVRLATATDAEFILRPPMGSHFGERDSQLSSYNIWLANLPSRGWVFQEALLSPRILYFGKGLFWTCRRGQASEQDPQGRGFVPQGVMYGRHSDAIFPTGNAPREQAGQESKKEPGGSGLLDMFFRGQPAGGNAPGREPYEALLAIVARGRRRARALDYKFHQCWMQLLRIYGDLNLTVATDRLPALAGIVRIVMDSVKWKYLAGLWEPTLCLDLVWTLCSDPKPRPNKYLAPSWSWASVEGAVGTNLLHMNKKIRGGMQVLTKVVSATTKCHDTDLLSTGQVFEGTLTLHGLVIEGNVTRRTEDILYLANKDDISIGDVHLDITNHGVSDKVFILPVLRALEDTFEHHSPKMLVHGLALVDKGEHFERVGYYCFSYPQEETIDFLRYKGTSKLINIK